MKVVFILLFNIILIQSIMAQTENFKTIPDPKEKGSNMLVGQISINDIKAEPTCGWFNRAYNKYNTDSATIALLKKVLNNYTLIVAAGTWCEDTQILLPALYKVLDSCAYNTTSIELLAMNRNKHALNIEHLLLKIEFLPTIIIRKGPREVGRIVESLKKESIEKELLSIIENDMENWRD
jgi:hypothetical protein